MASAESGEVALSCGEGTDSSPTFTIIVTRKVAEQSVVIKDMLSDMCGFEESLTDRARGIEERMKIVSNIVSCMIENQNPSIEQDEITKEEDEIPLGKQEIEIQETKKEPDIVETMMDFVRSPTITASKLKEEIQSKGINENQAARILKFLNDPQPTTLSEEKMFNLKLDGIEGKILEKVVFFCTHYTEKDFDEKAFCEVGAELMIQIVAAANYLGIISLVKMGCKKIADIINSHTPEGLRKVFQMSEDYTDELKKKVYAENEWNE